ncbi:magnetosome formation protease MamE [Magnetospirillum sp. UT-4]|uniref:magnetosome formation protease MamE n=1 Tax=Magnetospirillum sp. UT-4 TaxID=2681467 RepID=UPI001382BDFE|nr:magnetosome formation protease MamE [Magnetospirillum sp. UT-4]CAA7622268.1 Trypsin-like serine protease, typically periplasmic [Magnetospirillum sp. UT-4]
MFNGDVEGEGRPGGSCGKDLKRYLMLMAVVAAIVLFGAFIYRQSQGGLRLGAMFEQLTRGKHAAANVPVQQGGIALPAPGGAPVQAVQAGGNRVAPPTAAGAIATLPPVVDFGAAPVGGGAFSNVVTVLRNSVVSVSASSSTGQAMPDPLGLANTDGLPRFANPQTRTVENIGTGVIVRDDGFIVTNYHVVRGANSVFVTVRDDVGSTRYSAEVVKMDEALDLALLKVMAKTRLSSAVFGDSDSVRVADEVIAIGTPFGLDMTVSRGIISAKRKTMVIEGVTHSNLLQTDAAINQGNSGGPLVATTGAVIGINTAIYTPNGAFAGIGFAVSSNQARMFVMDEVGWLPTSTAEGPTMGLVAMQRPGPGGGFGAAGPAIMAGVPAPHTDGRQNMDCTTCHDIIPAGNQPAAGMGGPMLPVAAPVAPPPIPVGAVAPHTDGRQNMNCATCHQMIGGTGAAAPVAAPGYSYAQPPGSLAINVQGGRGGAAIGAEGRRSTLLGAALSPMSVRLSQQTGQPAGRGVYVTGVTPNTPAAMAGLRPGDVILKVDGRPVARPEEAIALLAEMPKGRSVRLGVLRDGDVADLSLSTGLAGLAAAAVQSPAMPSPAMQAPTAGAGRGAAMAGVPGAARTAPAVPTEFNWLGMEIETFQSPVASPRVGAPAGGTVAGPAAATVGAQVAEVLAGSRAARAGLQTNDYILQVNNRPVSSPAQLDGAIKTATQSGQQILLRVHRNGQEFWVVL